MERGYRRMEAEVRRRNEEVSKIQSHRYNVLDQEPHDFLRQFSTQNIDENVIEAKIR